MSPNLKNFVRFGVEIAQALYSFFDDSIRYLRYSSTFAKKGDAAKLQGLIIRSFHGIEVGLTYKPLRAGASQKLVQTLTRQITLYLKHYPSDSFIESALNALTAYYEANRELGNALPDLDKSIRHLRSQMEEGSCGLDKENSTTNYSVPPAGEFDFSYFAKSRRSTRRFIDQPVDASVIRQAVSSALCSPSACNRQPCKVYDITDQQLKRKVLAIQNNASPWRETANHLLVVTSNLGLYSGIRERHCCHVDGGLFAMTLIYALHASGLGTCPLNLNLPVQLQNKLRKLLGAGHSEMFVMLIAVGRTQSTVTVPRGIRRKVDDVLISKTGPSL